MGSLDSFLTLSINDITLGLVISSGNERWFNKILPGVHLVLMWANWKWHNRVIQANRESVQSVLGEDFFCVCQITFCVCRTIRHVYT